MEISIAEYIGPGVNPDVIIFHDEIGGIHEKICFIETFVTFDYPCCSERTICRKFRAGPMPRTPD